MFWVRWSSFPTQYQAVFWSGDGTAGANAYDASAMLVNGNPADTLEFWGKNSTAPRMGPTANLAANTWYHFAVTYGTANGAACELFQDGVSVDTGTMGSAAAFQTEVTEFGNDANSDENPQARIMCGKMWNRILTAAEIRAEMWSALPVSADSLWGCWSMYDDSGGLHDLSGNGRHLVESGSLTVEASDCGADFDAPFTMGGWNAAAAAGQDINAGLNTSTHTAFAIAKRKARAAGLTTSTHTSLAARPTRLRPVGLVTQASSALAAAFTKRRTIGFLTQASSALAIAVEDVINVDVGQVLSTHAALAATWTKRRTLSIVQSVNQALALETADPGAGGAGGWLSMFRRRGRR
jgi:hypothetical protein